MHTTQVLWNKISYHRCTDSCLKCKFHWLKMKLQWTISLEKSQREIVTCQSHTCDCIEYRLLIWWKKWSYLVNPHRSGLIWGLNSSHIVFQICNNNTFSYITKLLKQNVMSLKTINMGENVVKLKKLQILIKNNNFKSLNMLPI